MTFKRIIAFILCFVLCLGITGCSSVKVQEPKEYLSELPEIENGEYPSSFDLRDYGVVTSVKSQGDLGCCWAFASVAAAESSILSELKTNINENNLNLSEHHLFWFAKHHIPAEGETGYDASNTQSGEGFYSSDAVSGSGLVEGAGNYSALMAFATGMGVASEETAPYKNTNGNITSDGDWSLDESLRYNRVYDLETGYILPQISSDGETLSENGINAVKEMLTQGKAVAIEYAYTGGEETADQSEESPYLNSTTYAHYTYESTATNHVVTIVGWDDDYDKSNFRSDAQPAGNGAWIVKNSWGAVTEESPNNYNWGVDGSGYFYLSYYDQSVSSPIAYDFDTATEGSAYAITQQYDLMNAIGSVNESESSVKEANIFTAPQDMDLEAVGVLCASENTTLNCQVYLLDNGIADLETAEPAVSFEKEYRYAGYYRETLDEAVTLKEGQQYAIVVTQRKQGENAVYYYQYGESLQGSGSIMALFSGAYDVGVINEGESYIYFENKGWQDLKDYVAEVNGDDTNSVADDNFCIKAFGN